MALTLMLNGETQTYNLEPGPICLTTLLDHLGLKADRIAVERNGVLMPRTTWTATELVEGDKLEIVHFVGGGADEGFVAYVAAH